jgi:energy-coupling factor transport system ATP-binding protein
MITIHNLRYRSFVIDGLEIKPGITSVIGPNGSGKTTFLKLCAGIAEPESGSVLIDGLPPRHREVGWVNEVPDRNILFGTTPEEIASPLRFRHLPCREISDRVNTCMESMGISHLNTRHSRELSGGEKILVALAAALVIKPYILVLDEYDSHLDAISSSDVEQQIRHSGTPYVIRCTQQMDTAAQADSLIYVEAGRIRKQGTPENVFSTLTTTPFYPLSWRCNV